MKIWEKKKHKVAHRDWTDDELALLKAGLPVPTRTESQCRCKANSLGITFRSPTSNRWTKDEIAMAKKGEVPPGRTENAMLSYCRQHHIPVPKKAKHHFTDEQEKLILEDIVPEGCTENECRRHAFNKFRRGFRPTYRKVKEGRMVRGRQIVEMRDVAKLSFPEMSRILGVSRQRAHQLYNFYSAEVKREIAADI